MRTQKLFFFELGQWQQYVMLLVVIFALAAVSWAAIRYKWVAIAVFIVIPVALTIFWWPYSTAGTKAAGWFPIVKQYSALLGSLSLVALQYFPALRRKYWYLCIPPLILAVNIAEAVVRDIQCYFISGVDPSQGITTIGGPWNLMNAVAGILNLLMISGWVGIYVAKGKMKSIIWLDLTLGWIIAYDLWNFAYVYNCLSDRAWYSGLALLASCTIPALCRFGRGAWIQYRAYTLTLWSAVVLTFPHFMHDSQFAHASSNNPAALFVMSLAALLFNAGLAIYHVRRLVVTKRNLARQELYADLPSSLQIIRDTASEEDRELIATRLGRSRAQLSI